MGAYLDVPGFTSRTIMPAEDVTDLQTRYPGYLDSRLTIGTSLINARLQKRYAVPFGTTSTPPTGVPEIVLGWLTALVTVDAYKKRGWNPSDAQSAEVLADRQEALDQIKEASDSETGLFELPLSESNLTSAATKQVPAFYSETSPYRWTTLQRQNAEPEDENL